MNVSGGGEGEKERGRLPAEWGAQTRAPSLDPEILT